MGRQNYQEDHKGLNQKGRVAPMDPPYTTPPQEIINQSITSIAVA